MMIDDWTRGLYYYVVDLASGLRGAVLVLPDDGTHFC